MPARARIVSLFAALVAIALGVALAGCGSGSGGAKGTVEQAFLDFGANTKSAKFVGTMSMSDPTKGQDTVAMKLDMRMDVSDPAKPAVSMAMSGGNKPGTIELVVLGTDLYLTADGKSHVVDMSEQIEQMKSFAFKNQLEMLKAISDSVGNYKQAGTDSVDGVQVDLYTGDLDVGKLIDGLLPTVEKMFPSGTPGGFGGEGGSEMISGLVKSMVKEPVKMWFGVDDQGVLRLIAFELKLSMPFAMEGQKAEPIAIKARFEAHDVNQPVEIVAPKDAEPAGDFSALQSLMK